jgi:histidine ammonia-lyase
VTQTPPIEIDGRHLTLEEIEAVAFGASIRISPAARERVARAREFVESHLAAGESIYGVTTGFGKLANIVIAPEDAAELQLNLVRSHAAGTGAPLEIPVVRAAGVLRANSLSAGHSGVKPQTLALIVGMLERGVTPVVPSVGSLGASGDLAPLAHMTLALIGEGEAFFRGEPLPSAVALERAGLKPIELGAKEGLALVNGTQVMTAIAALSVVRAQRLAAAADVIGAMSLEAYLGSLRPPHQRPAAPSGTGAGSGQLARAAQRFGDRVVARGVSTRPRSVLVPLHSGRSWSRARLDGLRASRHGSRGKLGNR